MIQVFLFSGNMSKLFVQACTIRSTAASLRSCSFRFCAHPVMFRAQWCFLLRSLPLTEISEIVLCSVTTTLCMSETQLRPFPNDCRCTLRSHQQWNKSAVKYDLRLSISSSSSVVDSTEHRHSTPCPCHAYSVEGGVL